MLKLQLFSGAAAALLVSACASSSVPAPHPLDVSVAEPVFLIDTYDGDFVDIQQMTTPGGVSVWLVTEPSIPIVSVQMAWRAGTTSDPAGLEGLSNAVTYNMNEGAGDLDSLAFQTAMEDLNMSFGCSNSAEWTSCSATMLAENAAPSMEVVASAFTAPRFDQGPFDRFVREQEVALKTRETSAGYLAWRAQSQALYPDHPFAREVTAESLAALTPDLARQHQRTLMTKDRLLVTAVGDITPEALAPLIDAAVAALPETSDLSPVTPITLPAVAAADPVVVSLPQPQSLVRFLGPGLGRDNADYFPAYVLNYTFGGGGFESRLMKTLRVEKGLTYGVSSSIDPNPAFLVWSGGGQTKNESAGEFVAGIRAEMQKFIEGGVTEAELADAKAYLIGSYPLGFDSNSKIAGNIMSVRQDELGVDYFDRRNALIEAVTLEDVNRVAAEYLAPERFSFFLVGEPEGLSAE
ncbi:insulinase family protein [Hyphomonas sp. WL0036]|uniref:M16 family metallopeptidase n=1 Tax=Hyphomonas sediminis TaxID=2866160 RepID=UPI001C815C4A|nr:pitrilysin family protein [Hyphomonas sediminis]MBY9068427.1 insulinase family protein [Hyphomonas sediminis]